jgi:hypothetical protein
MQSECICKGLSGSEYQPPEDSPAFMHKKGCHIMAFSRRLSRLVPELATDNWATHGGMYPYPSKAYGG